MFLVYYLVHFLHTSSAFEKSALNDGRFLLLVHLLFSRLYFILLFSCFIFFKFTVYIFNLSFLTDDAGKKIEVKFLFLVIFFLKFK